MSIAMLALEFIMPLIFHDPVVVNTNSSPADQFVESAGAGFDLGYTEPSYMGTVALQRRTRFGAAPPRTIPLHDVAITPSSGPGGGYRASVGAVHDHDFSWRIELPPKPGDQYIVNSNVRLGWKSKAYPIDRVLTLCREFKRQFPDRFAAALPDATQYTSGIVYLLPAPSVKSLFDHIENHEYQHAADHRWLAEQIFGPIDRWAQVARQKNLVFESDSRTELLAAVQFPGNYASSGIRVYEYWQKCIAASGDLYHHTAAGAAPNVTLIRYHGSNNDPRILVVAFEISAAQPIGDTSLHSPPHHAFALSGAGRALDGNEPPLQYGAVVDRTIHTPDVVSAADHAVFAIGGGPAPDLDTSLLYRDDEKRT
ncbi:hypothetical protein [Burkholderia stagnalis]|uniref:hypothetical protein n=1 Tax=Burkholderia stagnalis TaxID=1503054 RepID=UPI000F815EA7|nr:hypothetical protein [Burkholderia stagnalis]